MSGQIRKQASSISFDSGWRKEVVFWIRRRSAIPVRSWSRLAMSGQSRKQASRVSNDSGWHTEYKDVGFVYYMNTVTGRKKWWQYAVGWSMKCVLVWVSGLVDRSLYTRGKHGLGVATSSGCVLVLHCFGKYGKNTKSKAMRNLSWI